MHFILNALKTLVRKADWRTTRSGCLELCSVGKILRDKTHAHSARLWAGAAGLSRATFRVLFLSCHFPRRWTVIFRPSEEKTCTWYRGRQVRAHSQRRGKSSCLGTGARVAAVDTMFLFSDTPCCLSLRLFASRPHSPLFYSDCSLNFESRIQRGSQLNVGVVKKLKQHPAAAQN